MPRKADPLRVSRFLAKQRHNAVILERVRKYVSEMSCSCMDSGGSYEGMWPMLDCCGDCDVRELEKLLKGERI